MKKYVIRYIHALDGVELYHTDKFEDSEELQDAMILGALDIQRVLDESFKTHPPFVETDGEYYAHEILEVTVDSKGQVWLS